MDTRHMFTRQAWMKLWKSEGDNHELEKNAVDDDDYTFEENDKDVDCTDDDGDNDAVWQNLSTLTLIFGKLLIIMVVNYIFPENICRIESILRL